jgi:hypothetical protein
MTGSGAPKEMQKRVLARLAVAGLALKHPLDVFFERGEVGYSVYDEAFGVLGAGPTPEEAKEDYQYALYYPIISISLEMNRVSATT